MLISLKEARSLLPNVGDVRWESPVQNRGVKAGDSPVPPERCTVVEVNAARLWYRVRFDSGFCECYKVPKLKRKPLGGLGA